MKKRTKDHDEARLGLYKDLYDAVQFVFNQCPPEKRVGHFEFDEFAKQCFSDPCLTVSTIYLASLWLLLIFEGSFSVISTLEGYNGELGELEIGVDDHGKKNLSDRIVEKAQRLTSDERLSLIHKAAELYRR